MKGLGTIVNAAAILLGGGAGLLFHKGIPPKLQERVMEALALGVILIGLSGALKGEKTLVMILSLAVGAAIGALLSIDDGFHRLAGKLSGKLVGPDKQAGFAAGFVSASLLFCTGAMAVTGALQDGFSADHATLFAKALIDGISAMLLGGVPLPGPLHRPRHVQRLLLRRLRGGDGRGGLPPPGAHRPQHAEGHPHQGHGPAARHLFTDSFLPVPLKVQAFFRFGA